MTESTGELLMLAARALRRELGAAMTSYDVSPGQARALRLVCELGAVRPSVLAERLRIAPRSVTEVVDALESRRLVERRADPDDRRATDIVPTDDGLRLWAVIDDARRAASTDYLDRLGGADRVELDRILRLLVDS